MVQKNFMIFNQAATVDGADDLNMYDSDNLLAMDSTGAGVVTMYFRAWNEHVDAPDDIALTVVSSGDDEADRVNRVAAIDAMVSKANAVNRNGYVVAWSENEGVKPGGISAAVPTLDS
jgi:hypothetical protein